MKNWQQHVDINLSPFTLETWLDWQKLLWQYQHELGRNIKTPTEWRAWQRHLLHRYYGDHDYRVTPITYKLWDEWQKKLENQPKKSTPSSSSLSHQKGDKVPKADEWPKADARRKADDGPRADEAPKTPTRQRRNTLSAADRMALFEEARKKLIAAFPERQLNTF